MEKLSKNHTTRNLVDLFKEEDIEQQLQGASFSVMPLSTYLNLGLGELAHTRLTVELVDRTMKYPKGIAENMLVGIGKFTFPIYFVILDMPEDIKVPLILRRQFLSMAHAKIDVYKRKITLKIIRPFLGNCIELNDLNEPFELKRNQGDDLMPIIEEGEVIEEFRTRDEDLDTVIDDYPRDNVVGALINVLSLFREPFSVMTGFSVLELIKETIQESKVFDEFRSLDFIYFSNQEYSEEDRQLIAMAVNTYGAYYEAMTRTDYGSGVARPKIDDKDQFELKDQFLKELRENTFSGSDNEDANKTFWKVLE
ncbi:putative reverse transcriptase domain-containing protein [Tanacetum coccineum]